jgi:glycosyltransferase involved in cell wall biosynthesis
MIPQVSVVIVTYNSGQYVAKAIESVLSQTNEDFEIVVQDDCSVDDTVEVVRSFSDNRIRLFRNPANVGIVTNSNLGIANARGEFVSRLDADDLFLGRHLEVCARALNAHPSASLAYGRALVLEDDHLTPFSTPPILPPFESGKRFLLMALRSDPCASCATMFRRQAFLLAGSFRDSHLASPIYNDYSLWLRLAIVGDVARVEDRIGVWVKRRDSVSSTASTDLLKRFQFRYQEDMIDEVVSLARARGVLSSDDVCGLRPLLARRWLYAADACAFLPEHRSYCIKRAWDAWPWVFVRTNRLARIGAKRTLGPRGVRLLGHLPGRG